MEKYYCVVIDKVEKVLFIKEVKGCMAMVERELQEEYSLPNRMTVNARFGLFFNGTKDYIDYDTFYKKYAKWEVVTKEENNKEEVETMEENKVVVDKNTELKDLETKTVSKKCLYINNNKAIVRNKDLISLAAISGNDSLKNVYIEKKEYSISLYIDFGIICNAACNVSEYMTIEQLEEALFNKDLHNYTYTQEKERILNNANNSQFVNVQEIRLFELMGESQEAINMLINARETYLKQKEEQREQERKAKEDQERQFLADKQKEIDLLINEVEQAILNKNTITNKDIRVYSSVYEYKETSLVLYMFNLYDIKVPLKTQGWINNALVDINYNNNKWSYRYYSSSKNSTVFRDYLNQLVKAVEEKHGIISIIDTEEQKQEKERKEYEKNIPDLKFTKITGNMRYFMDINIFKRLEEPEITQKEEIQLLEMMYKHFKVNVNEAITNRLLFDFMHDKLIVHYGDKSIKCYIRNKNGKQVKLFIKNTKKDTYICYM